MQKTSTFYLQTLKSLGPNLGYNKAKGVPSDFTDTLSSHPSSLAPLIQDQFILFLCMFLAQTKVRTDKNLAVVVDWNQSFSPGKPNARLFKGLSTSPLDAGLQKAKRPEAAGVEAMRPMGQEWHQGLYSTLMGRAQELLLGFQQKCNQLLTGAYWYWSCWNENSVHEPNKASCGGSFLQVIFTVFCMQSYLCAVKYNAFATSVWTTFWMPL